MEKQKFKKNSSRHYIFSRRWLNDGNRRTWRFTPCNNLLSWKCIRNVNPGLRAFQMQFFLAYPTVWCNGTSRLLARYPVAKPRASLFRLVRTAVISSGSFRWTRKRHENEREKCTVSSTSGEGTVHNRVSFFTDVWLIYGRFHTRHDRLILSAISGRFCSGLFYERTRLSRMSVSINLSLVESRPVSWHKTS